MNHYEDTVNQAISDFDDIEEAIEDMGVDVPEGTPTSEYSDLIRDIETGTDDHSELDNLEYENSGHTGFQREVTEDNKLDYSLISNTPIIPSKLSELADDQYHRVITDNDYYHRWLLLNKVTNEVHEEGEQENVPNEHAVIEFTENKFVKKDGSKVLSDNNYTTAEKTKLASLENYDDTEVRGLIGSKQDEITSDNKLSYNLLSDAPSIPSKTSDLTNDSGYITDAYHDDSKVDKDGIKVLSDNNYTTTEKEKLASLENYDDAEVRELIDDIEEKIPTQASSSNQLADKNFVNSSINSVTAYYITKNASGEPFSTKAELTNATVFYSGGEVRVPTRNDYCVVIEDESKTDTITGEKPTTRYIYQTTQWEFQFIVNKTSLTAAQLEAINSGITDTLVENISDNTNARHTHTNKTVLDGISSSDISNWNGKVDSEVGKGLSSNDYTNAEKTKLEAIDMSTKQDTLVSRENIKTINNQSILGSGNIDIHGGGIRISDFQNYGMYIAEDITEEIAKYTDAYIDSLGDLYSSTTHHLYKIDLSKYKLTYFKAHSRSTIFYSVAFYSSTDTFDNTTFIANGSLKGTEAVDTEYEFDNIVIPDGALTVLLYSYSSYDKVIRGISYYTVANDATKQNKTDYTLQTTAKTVVGAINELNASIGDINSIIDIINGEVIE